jgi:hypothetical protein
LDTEAGGTRTQNFVVVVAPDLGDCGADVLSVHFDPAVVLKGEMHRAGLGSILAGDFGHVTSHAECSRWTLGRNFRVDAARLRDVSRQVGNQAMNGLTANIRKRRS